MKQVWMRGTATAALGLVLLAAGCGDKQGESGTRPPPAGLAPAPPPETTGPEGNPSQGGSSEPGMPGANKEQRPEDKAQ
jgi:hypothetical protein